MIKQKICSRGHTYAKSPCVTCWPASKSKKKPVIAVTSMDGLIEDLARKSEKKILVKWARDCAKRVLPYFENKYPDDKRPKLALEACREWLKTGAFSMRVVRKASLDSHAAARGATSDSARAAARSCGQAIAATHAKLHAIAAARYAISAIRDSSDNPDVATLKERNWQYKRLVKLNN